jgi:hypothetical protein
VIGIDDNFFEMGGTSLLTQRLANQLEKVLTSMSATTIYQYPTIVKLCEFVENTSQTFSLTFQYQKRISMDIHNRYGRTFS